MQEPKARKPRVELRSHDRRLAFCILQAWIEDGRPKLNSINIVAKMMSVHRATVSRLWRDISSRFGDFIRAHPENEEHDNMSKFMNTLSNFDNGAVGLRGRKFKYDRDELKKVARDIPLVLRQDFRAFANALGIPHSTVHRMTQDGVFVVKKSTIKPDLTEDNMVLRVSYALDEVVTHARGTRLYKEMYDRVHVDEKWFYITKVSTRYILVAADDEDEKEVPSQEPHCQGYVYMRPGSSSV
jgi:DNA-binding Lrp family transcriptional regulator